MTTVSAHLGQALSLMDQLNQQHTPEREQQLDSQLGQIQQALEVFRHESFIFKMEYEVQRKYSNPMAYNFPLFAALVAVMVPDIEYWFAMKVSVFKRQAPDELILTVGFNPMDKQFAQDPTPSHVGRRKRMIMLEASRVLLEYFDQQNHVEKTIVP